MNLLPFHREIISELIEKDQSEDQIIKDGLVILANGLGLELLQINLLHFTNTEKALVLLLNVDQNQTIPFLNSQLALLAKDLETFKPITVINNQTNSNDR